MVNKSQEKLQEKSQEKMKWFGLSLCILLTCFVLGLVLGSVNIDFSQITQTDNQIILWELRLPRVLTALAAGGLLALNGVLLQALTQNPLSDAGLLGTSSGAASMAALSLLFGWAVGYLFIPAFFGALLASFLVILLAKKTVKLGILGVLLGGMAINSLAGAILGLFQYFAPEESLRNFIFWSLGSCAQSHLWQAFLLFMLLIFQLIWASHQSRNLDGLLLGEAEARYLGVKIALLKNQILFITAITTGIVVSLTGFIGFIGLLVPHFVRNFTGVLHGKLVIYSGIWGGILLILADLLSRILLKPIELPVGIMTALLGAPFFLILLLKNRV